MEATLKSKAEDVHAAITSVQALVSAIDDGIYGLLDKQLWGPYWAVMQYNGKRIQALLAIAEGILHDMELEQSRVVRGMIRDEIQEPGHE